MAFQSCKIYQKSDGRFVVEGNLNGTLYQRGDNIIMEAEGDITGSLYCYIDGSYYLDGKITGGTSGYSGKVRMSGYNRGEGYIYLTGKIGIKNVTWNCYIKQTGMKEVIVYTEPLPPD